MSLENNIATLVQKSEQLTSTVDNKVAEIDASTASMLQRCLLYTSDAADE